MNRDFNLGRLYERREVFVFLAQVMNEPDPERREEMVRQWLGEAADSLHAPTRRVIFADDILVLV